MNFRHLHELLVAHLRERVATGLLTERSLAKVTGVSQPHIHHVLKGKRLLSAGMADSILHELGIDLWDLIGPQELLEWRRRH